MMAVMEDVVCPFCGCLCDDLEVTVEENRVVKTRYACAISNSKYLNHDENKILTPLVKGKPVSLKEAVNASASILCSSRRPLVYG